LAGYARSGKDEVAKILVRDYGYTRVAFADSIREFVLKVNPILETGYRVGEIVKEFGWDVAKSKMETRRLLQEVGVVARELFGEEFWVEQALKKIGYETGKDIPCN
jgi:dephospho-CoA kinase